MNLPNICLLMQQTVRRCLFSEKATGIYWDRNESWDIGEDQWEKHVKDFVWKVMFLY